MVWMWAVLQLVVLLVVSSPYEEGVPLTTLTMKCCMLMVSDLVVLLLGCCRVLKGVVLSWYIAKHHDFLLFLSYEN